MRWSIRYQLLIPLCTMLLGVAGISTWTAIAAANRSWQQIETQVRGVARTFAEAHFPVTEKVLQQTKGLSGAEYIFAGGDGRRLTTFASARTLSPAVDVAVEDWRSLYLGARCTVLDESYFLCGIRLGPPQIENSGILYILYPESLWRDARWVAVSPSLLLGGFTGLASLGMVLGVARGVGSRIRELVSRTRSIAAGDFRPMTITGRNDELRDLSHSVNDMALQLSRLHEAVQKNERLRLLGQVSGGLAHQLRNGVTGASLALQLHARECKNGADREALDVALRQLVLLESNLKRFLDLGRIEELQREPCSVTGVITDAVSLLQPQCRHSDIGIHWVVPDAPIIVSGDRRQLEHVFLNLLGNAVEAAGAGGTVEVRARLAAAVRSQVMEGKPARASCTVEVFDTGPGPSTDVADRVFEAFVTSKREGVGLGLAVARQVIEAHGGRIGWKRENERTCFRVELPLESEPLA